MKTYFSIHQTEANLKAYNVPINCHIPNEENPSIPAYHSDGILSLYMVMLDESILDYPRIQLLMKEYNVSKIILRSCYADTDPSRNVNRLVKCINSNIFAYLPESIDLYMAQLGAHTRRHIRAYEKKFFQAHDSVEFFTQYKSEVNEDYYKEIIRLNHERCEAKGHQSGISEKEVENLYEVIKLYGAVTIMMHKNKVIAGTISTSIGNERTLHVIAHDNSYNSFNIGNIIMKKTIEQAINEKIGLFNLTWGGVVDRKGKTNWKMQFGNQRWYLNDITYFKRSSDYYLAKIAFESGIFFRKSYDANYRLLQKIYHFAKKKVKNEPVPN